MCRKPVIHTSAHMQAGGDKTARMDARCSGCLFQSGCIGSLSFPLLFVFLKNIIYLLFLFFCSPLIPCPIVARFLSLPLSLSFSLPLPLSLPARLAEFSKLTGNYRTPLLFSDSSQPSWAKTTRETHTLPHTGIHNCNKQVHGCRWRVWMQQNRMWEIIDGDNDNEKWSQREGSMY